MQYIFYFILQHFPKEPSHIFSMQRSGVFVFYYFWWCWFFFCFYNSRDLSAHTLEQYNGKGRKTISFTWWPNQAEKEPVPTATTVYVQRKTNNRSINIRSILLGAIPRMQHPLIVSQIFSDCFLIYPPFWSLLHWLRDVFNLDSFYWSCATIF